MGLKDVAETDYGELPPLNFDRLMLVTAIATLMLGQLYILQSLDNSLEYAGIAKLVIPVLYYWTFDKQIAHLISVVAIATVKLLGLETLEEWFSMPNLPENHPWNETDDSDKSLYHCPDCGVTVPVTAADIQAGIRLYCPICDDEISEVEGL